MRKVSGMFALKPNFSRQSNGDFVFESTNLLLQTHKVRPQGLLRLEGTLIFDNIAYIIPSHMHSIFQKNLKFFLSFLRNLCRIQAKQAFSKSLRKNDFEFIFSSFLASPGFLNIRGRKPRQSQSILSN